MDLRALLGHVIEVGGSDLHLKVGSPPMIRVDGDLLAVSGVPAVSEGDTEDVLDLVTERTPRKREHFYETGEKRAFKSFWKDGCPLIRAKAIPAFTPRRWVSRADGVVV